MGTEVLRPHDVLFRESPAAFQRRRGFNGTGSVGGGNKKASASKPDKKKIVFSPEIAARKRAKKGSPVEVRKKEENGGLVMGKVTLLRRGDSLDSLTAKIKAGNGGEPKSPPPPPKPVEDLVVSDPESPETFLKQIRLAPPPLPDIYAGSAFFLSPSPRSVPLPSFFNQKKHEINAFTESATEDLRRLLRLE